MTDDDWGKEDRRRRTYVDALLNRIAVLERNERQLQTLVDRRHEIHKATVREVGFWKGLASIFAVSWVVFASWTLYLLIKSYS